MPCNARLRRDPRYRFKGVTKRYTLQAALRDPRHCVETRYRQVLLFGFLPGWRYCVTILVSFERYRAICATAMNGLRSNQGVGASVIRLRTSAGSHADISADISADCWSTAEPNARPDAFRG